MLQAVPTAGETIQRLTAIPGRGAGTDAERRAAVWLEHDLAARGNAAWTDTYWVRPGWAWPVALAAALGAGGSALWYRNRQQALDDCRNGEATMMGKECYSESTIVSQRRTAIGLTIGLGAAAVVSGVVAGLLWPHSEQSAAPTVACVPTNNMVSCEFRF